MSNIITLPGFIDIHVHFRDPGEEYKEDFYTGTLAALNGGVVKVFDMPNNFIPVTTWEKLEDKIRKVSKEALCDWGLYFGTDGKNIDEFARVCEKVVGLKLYLSSTTGKLVVSDKEALRKIFTNWPKEKIIVIHAEGKMVDLALMLAKIYENRIHITHISTRDTIDKIIRAKRQKIRVTCDVTPHHLFLTNKILTLLKNFGMVKPPLATKRDCDYLWENLKWIDCICTDHAPHSAKEKQSSPHFYGLPGLETMLPLLITAYRDGRITLEDIIRLTSEMPKKIFSLKREENTYIEVDIENKYKIKDNNLKTKCAWSPFNNWTVYGKVIKVIIRGKKVFENGKILVSAGFGKNIVC